MTTTDIEEVPPPRRATPDTAKRRERAEKGRLLRRMWRLHFYAGAIAGPFLLLLSLTGLVILYTQPIQDALHSHLLKVPAAATSVPLSQQVDAALAAHPGFTVDSVTPPADAGRTTLVALTDGESPAITNVYVDPHTGRVVGEMVEGDDIVGLANRLHGSLNNESVTVPLPSISHLIDPAAHPDAITRIAIGSLIMEVITIWALVLALTGIYLWWPRSSQKGKPKLKVRWSKGGRLRWQDLHSASGILVAGILAVFVVSGMPWSDYWGTDWSTVAGKITPNKTVATESTPATIGDLDRFGRHVEWSEQDDRIPASGAPVAATLGYTDIEAIARQEGMLPGYSIIPPADTPGGHEGGDHGGTVYGSYTLWNHWPQKLSEQRTLYLDQFTGDTIADTTAADKGFLKRMTSFGVNLHMGTQYGLLTRVLATLGCVLLVVSVLSSYVMWWLRRPTGTAGLPKRPARKPGTRSVGTPAMTVVGFALALVYPAFGATLLAVVALDTAVYQYRKRRGGVADDDTAAREDVAAR